MTQDKTHLTDHDLPDTPVVLDMIKNFVAAHSFNISEGFGVVTLHNGDVYRVLTEHPKAKSIGYISLTNDQRVVVFESVAELRGWLRCHRAMSILPGRS
jgi:hypothetical protein